MSAARRISVAWLWLAPLFLVVLVALVQWTPLLTLPDPQAAATLVRPYTPLELRGRDIYLREGCGRCHSQTVRLLEVDVRRYGWPGGAAVARYDHPTQGGSRRYGPDLSLIGGRLPDHWYQRLLADPAALSPLGAMPAYPWLASNKLSYADLPERMRRLRRLGVPYSLTNSERNANLRRYGAALASQFDILHAEKHLAQQASEQDRDGDPARITEMDALIAYLQSLGQRVLVGPAARSTPASGEVRAGLEAGR